MREHTYPGSYESHLRRRVKELEREKQRLFNLLEDATFIAIQALNIRTERLEVPDSFEVSHDPETGELRLEPRE